MTASVKSGFFFLLLLSHPQPLFSSFTFSSSTRLQLTAVPLIRSVNAVIDAVTYPINNNDDDMVIFALCNGLGMGSPSLKSGPSTRALPKYFPYKQRRPMFVILNIIQ